MTIYRTLETEGFQCEGFLSGLEAQLLGIVVRKERPDLEEQKDSLVRSIAAGKKKLVELEDEILRSVDWSGQLRINF